MLIPNYPQTIETLVIEDIFISDTIHSLLEKLSNQEYSRNLILQKPYISELITLLLSQNTVALFSNEFEFYVFFNDHLCGI